MAVVSTASRRADRTGVPKDPGAFRWSPSALVFRSIAYRLLPTCGEPSRTTAYSTFLRP
jgi:hypothetical protein